MAALIADPGVEERLLAERRARGWDRKDEVWNGIYIIMPDPNVEHQELMGQLTVALSAVVRPPAGGKVYPGLNLSDRIDDWKYNYRCPDVAVFLAGKTPPKCLNRIYAARPISWLRSSAQATRAVTSWRFMQNWESASCSSSTAIPGRWSFIAWAATNWSWRAVRATNGTT